MIEQQVNLCPTLASPFRIAASSRIVLFEKAWEACHQNIIRAPGFQGLPFLVLLSFREEGLEEVLLGINFDFCL